MGRKEGGGKNGRKGKRKGRKVSGIIVYLFEGRK